MVEMISVSSSNVAEIGYDAEQSQLHVRYVKSPSLYVYESVPVEVFEQLMQSPSKGSFLHRQVKGIYSFYVS